MARPRTFDEQQVLTAVRDQFWDAGYADTSLEDLMRVTGLGKGSLYAAFGDKHRLFLRALRGYVDDSHGHLRQLLDSAPRAVDALRSFLMAPVSDPDGAARGCLMANSTCELASTDPDVLAEARRAYDTTTALVAECVARAQREGDVAGDADPVETARALLTAQQGIVYMGRAGTDVAALSATARTLADRLLPRP
ncbi:MAG TPA: TetR/AcrR family transcriptional regulator [Pseudonocardia sp.]|jgi:AcrR family transcriptional regulator|uniref:TetR/AcrR family transcriptional regulator n=1 Tax=Pseudonocardia sp. TaxID=60912 RepID=UPI002B4ACF3E|nr:TetR/AcrR family transcriptional regulator [Pseudonocardia sp.]HLU60302.1 TetR/AcrR family transcriptional regulator [Pseudonocardia sp.]